MPLRHPLDILWKTLASKHVLWLVPAIAAGWLAFGLDLGWIVDDHVHRAALIEHPDFPDLHRTPGSLFAFIDGDPEELEKLVKLSLWPWWSAPELRLSFWRPVTGWSHALDYRAWPDNPRLMHLQSLLWFLLTVVLLLALYRRILPMPAATGLAGLVYAIDDSQALPALWLANRNAVIATAFGVASLLAHDRWRRDGWRAGMVVGPLLLLAAVLANEGAVAIGGYLVAYALFLDPAPGRGRFLALLPSTVMGLAWTLAYKLGGYGAVGSGVYVDPAGEPGRFALAAFERAPILLWGWWGFPGADTAVVLSDAGRRWLWLVAVVLLAILSWCVRHVLRRQPAARFCGLGMLLALVPASSIFPSNRLLVFVGIGASGLLALLMADLANRRGWGSRVLLALLVLVHLIAAPLLIRPYAGQMQQMERMIRVGAQSLVERTSDPASAPEDATVIIVASPSAFISHSSALVATLVDGWPARPTFVLSSSLYDTEVTRTDDSTLVIRPRGGFLRARGAPRPAGLSGDTPVLEPGRALLMLDLLFRDPERDRFEVGDRVLLQGAELEILEEEAGRPLAVACRFAAPLKSERWVFLAWRRGRYEPFPLPEIGDSVHWPGLWDP